jgi:LysR family transcriptional regulator, low CO2-responsive transcriptional regulator
MISASARRLSVFKSVVDCGGFNLAAMRLGIAQPSVGAHIKALESQVGQPLFLRNRGSRPQLTKAGEAVYAFAVDVLDKSEATTQALAEIRTTTAHEVAIAVHRDIAPHFLPARLTAFTAQYPKVRVITRIGTIDEVIGLIRARESNLGLFLASGPTTGMRSEILDREPLTLVAASHHPLANDKALTARKLGLYPFVTGLRGSRYFRLTDAALKKIGITTYEIAMELEESTATKEMVRHGVGIACLPRCTVAAELATGSLVELKPNMRLQALELRCGYAGSLTENAITFLNWLRMSTRKLKRAVRLADST